MTVTIAKSAIAVFAALALNAGVAAAEDADLVENINTEMDAQQEQTFEIVAASAELRVAALTEQDAEDDDNLVNRELFNGS